LHHLPSDSTPKGSIEHDGKGKEMQTISRNLILTAMFSMACVCAQVQVIPQATDGANWRFTLVATNTTSSDTTALLAFYQDTGGGNTATWTPPFLEGGNFSTLTLPAGSSVFLHSPGTASTLTQGWAQITSSPGVESYIIYTYSPGNTSSDATAPAAPSASRILVPFDNTGSLSTALAVANPNLVSETISVNIRSSTGNVSTDSLSIPAQGHVAVVMPSQFTETKGQAGLAEFYTSSGTFSIIALRANNNPSTGLFSFTSAPVYSETGPPIITTGSTGGGAGDIVDAAFSIGIMNLTVSGSPMVSDLVGGAIGRYTPTEWNAPFSGTKYGPCIVYDTTFAASGNSSPGSGDSDLDAGNPLGLSGPNLPSGTTVPGFASPVGMIYSQTFPAGTLQPGGTYTLTGPGGTQVKAFDVSTSMPSNFTVTNWSAINLVNKSQAFTLNWTGAQGNEVVTSVSSVALSGTTVHAVFVGCAVPGSAGTLTIPQAALTHLLTAQAGSVTDSGTLVVEAVPSSSATFTGVSSNQTSFLPDLVGGGKANYGAFSSYIGYEKGVNIQ
jgi:hypothetical protein